mgnify:CR=1 FL=1
MQKAMETIKLRPPLAVNDPFCGYYLTHKQQKYINIMALHELKKPINQRIRPHIMVELVRHMITE